MHGNVPAPRAHQFNVRLPQELAVLLAVMARQGGQSLSGLCSSIITEVLLDDQAAHERAPSVRNTADPTVHDPVPQPPVDDAPMQRTVEVAAAVAVPVVDRDGAGGAGDQPLPAALSPWEKQRRLDDLTRQHPASKADLLRALAASTVKVTRCPAGQRYVEPTIKKPWMAG